MKLKNSNGDKKNNNDKTKKTQIVIKTQKPNFWHNLSQIEPKLKNSNCDNSKMTTQELKLWQNSKTEIATKLELGQSQLEKNKTLKVSFSKNILTPWQPMGCSLGSVLRFLQFFLWTVITLGYFCSRCFFNNWAIRYVLKKKLVMFQTNFGHVLVKFTQKIWYQFQEIKWKRLD